MDAENKSVFFLPPFGIETSFSRVVSPPFLPSSLHMQTEGVPSSPPSPSLHQVLPVRNTLGGKTYPVSITQTVRGTIQHVGRDTEFLWTLWIVPDDASTVSICSTVRAMEADLHAKFARPDQTLRSTIEGTDPVHLRVHLPTDPVPPPQLRSGARITAHLTCTGFHVFLEDCGITWRVTDVTLHRSRSSCLFSKSTIT